MWMSWVMMPRKLLLDSPTLLKYEWLFALNPMYGIIEAVRHFALGGPDFPWNPMHLVIGSSIATVMCVVGMFYFRKTERRFADIA
jgi:lipopolysaccharide transport system permease protein